MPYGYVVASGYVGRIDGRMMLFATEGEYLEILEESD